MRVPSVVAEPRGIFVSSKDAASLSLAAGQGGKRSGRAEPFRTSAGIARKTPLSDYFSKNVFAYCPAMMRVACPLVTSMVLQLFAIESQIDTVPGPLHVSFDRE